jgi:hypothetical protein
MITNKQTKYLQVDAARGVQSPVEKSVKVTTLETHTHTTDTPNKHNQQPRKNDRKERSDFD